jgi:hypothetical protein
MAHASKKDYETALEGLDFPTSKSAVINRARDNGGIDREVYAVLDDLPDAPFDSLDALLAAIRDVYVAKGEPAASVPV